MILNQRSSKLEATGPLAYLARGELASALASADFPATEMRPWMTYAAYRLGLYNTVAQAGWDGQHRYLGVARAVSLAACGQADAAQEVVQQLLAQHGRCRWVHSLADALAPFAPGLALSVLGDEAPRSPLGLALLLRTGAVDAAAASVQAALSLGQECQTPELWLWATNALGGDPTQQLQRLNAYLNSFGLAPVALRDLALPPGAGNLQNATALPAVEGPLVSVIMTAYNAAERIGSAITGLLAQTWRNLEVLVIDDASSDATGALVQRIAEGDVRVRYLRLPCNVGTYVAKTVGLELARGEFVTCHDSDDWSHQQRIELQMQPLLQDPKLVATTSKWVRVQDDGVFYARPVHPLARLNPASPLFRKQAVVKTTGAWDAVRTGADSEFYTRLRLVFGRRAVRRLAQPLALGAHRSDSLMNATATGYTAEGVSPTRLAYWEAWTLWQLDCLRRGAQPAMPCMGQGTVDGRAFAAPADIVVPQADVTRCMTFAASVQA